VITTEVATSACFAGVAFIGYGIIFFIRNFTGDFLELGMPGSGRTPR
jgi:hypothetical protein